MFDNRQVGKLIVHEKCLLSFEPTNKLSKRRVLPINVKTKKELKSHNSVGKLNKYKLDESFPVNLRTNDQSGKCYFNKIIRVKAPEFCRRTISTRLNNAFLVKTTSICFKQKQLKGNNSVTSCTFSYDITLVKHLTMFHMSTIIMNLNVSTDDISH